MTRHHRYSIGAAMVMVAMTAAACSGAGSSSGQAKDEAGGGRGGDSAMRAVQPEATARNSAAVGSPGAHFVGAAPLPRVGPSIIKTAQLELGVARSRITASVQRAGEIAGRYGGFVASTDVHARAARGTVVVRVPAPHFEEALSQLHGLGSERREEVSGVDVSGEVVDLQARLRNWQAQEAVLLRLMGRAVTVTDSIRVQGELGRVQLEIERVRGRLDYLADQTDLGTITTTFVGAGPAAPARPTTLARAWQRATRAALAVVAGVIVGVGYLVPLALLGGVALWLVRLLWPRLGGRAARARA